MPFCANCGHEVAEGVAFCPQCGAAVGGSSMAMSLTPTRDYAGFGTRFVGHLIDVILVGILGAVVGGIEQQIYGFSIVGNLLGIAYVWYFTAQGQTLGQRAMSIRVIDAAGNPPGGMRALGRLAASILSSIPLFLGYFWALWQPEKRTWHDSLAGTWVVRA